MLKDYLNQEDEFEQDNDFDIPDDWEEFSPNLVSEEDEDPDNERDWDD